MKKKYPYEKGFTLLELLVVIVIVGVLTSLFIVSYSGRQNKTNLDLEVRKIVSDIRWVQNAAISGKEMNLTCKAYGWGLYLTRNGSSYHIFTDCNNNKSYDSGEAYKTIAFPSNIRLSQLQRRTTSGSTLSRANITIDFVPPDPVIYFDTSLNNYTNVIITVRDSNTSQTKTITITRQGVISY